MITAHIGPDLGLQPTWAQITTYEGGSSTRLEWRDPVERRLRTSRPGGGARGHVTDFSRSSRRRLFRLLGTVNRYQCPTPPTFLTLTYPGVWLQKSPQVRANVRAFLKRLRRRYGRLAVIWRLEYQRRGAPHLHMLVFDPPEHSDLHAWALGAWFDVVGTDNTWHLERGVDVRAITSWRAVAGYVGKYLGKLHDGHRVPPDHEGRFWGVECRDSLPVEPVSFAVAIKAGLQARRSLLRAAKRSRRGDGPLKSASILVDSGVVRRLVRFLDPDSLEWGGHAVRPPGELCWELALGA